MLLVLAYAPLYRLMDTSSEAPHREVSVEVAELTLQLAMWGTVVTLLLAWILARLFSGHLVRNFGRLVMRLLTQPPLAVYSLAMALLTGTLTIVTSRFLYLGFFTNVDEIASTLHARYLASGLMAGPTSAAPEAWLIPNTLMVQEGWVSHFPPIHLLAMAGLARIGTPMLLGPLSAAALSGLIALSLPRLLPKRTGVTRLCALAVALSPFVMFLGAGSMSHVSTAALGAAVLYAGLRAREDGPLWSVMAGAAVGLMVADRPLIGLVLGTVLTLGLWVPAAFATKPGGLRWLLQRIAGTLVGGAPFAALLGWYNHRLFGHPLTLGYLAAFGDRHQLGFHMDPWSYEYGLQEAAAFTSTDVLNLGIQLLETPFPLTAVIGLWLLLRARVGRGEWVLLAWAFLPVLANGYYWFHDVRMLFEAAPAWIVLGVLGTVDLAREPVADDRLRRLGSDVAAWTAMIGVIGAALWGVPTRWGSYRWTDETLQRITSPTLPTAEPAIVFVHTSWNERLSSILQGAGGMRQDSVITALRRNTNCGLHLYALGREALVHDRSVVLPVVDLYQVPGIPPDIERPPAPAGATVRVRRGEPFPEICGRERRADRFGAVALAPLLWQGALPGIDDERPLFVRDLGPERNRRLLDRYPERYAFVFVPKDPEQPPEIVPYAEAMVVLWGTGISSSQNP